MQSLGRQRIRIPRQGRYIPASGIQGAFPSCLQGTWLQLLLLPPEKQNRALRTGHSCCPETEGTRAGLQAASAGGCCGRVPPATPRSAPGGGRLQVGLEQDCPPASTVTHLLSPGVSRGTPAPRGSQQPGWVVMLLHQSCCFFQRPELISETPPVTTAGFAGSCSPRARRFAGRFTGLRG